MSNWTTIYACIHLETEIHETNIKEVVEECLQNAPKITGSEGNADMFVNVPSGHTRSTMIDCEHCPFGRTIIHYKEGFTCKKPEGYECKGAEYQTTVIITIAGSLRDRDKLQTATEYKAFLEWLSKNFYDIAAEVHLIN